MKSSKKDEIIKYIEENYDNKEIIKEYVYNYPFILEYIDQNLLSERDFCMELLYTNGMALAYMPEKIRKDKELVIIALNRSAGFALKFADESLKKDIEVVKHAIQKYKEPLKYASEDLQKYFKTKWEEYFEKHINEKWSGYKVAYNGIKNTKEEMDKIYEKEKYKKEKTKNRKDDADKTLKELKESLEEMQIKFNEYDFEEND